MTHTSQFRIVVICLLAILGTAAAAQESEPIAYIGHGAFFDRSGKQIEVTPEFVARAQRWYRNKLAAQLPAAKKEQFESLEKRLSVIAPRADVQTRLVVQHRALDWLLANTADTDKGRTRGKLNALKFALQRKLDQRVDRDRVREKFTLDPELEKALKAPDLGGTVVFLATVNSGQAYLNECAANLVPIPPPIGVMDPNGTAGWKSQGFIPTSEQFIYGTPAEVRTYRSTSPAGLCIALPRYSDNTKATVDLDGVICISETTSKVCIWDNQMNGNGFVFNAGDKIPIGVPDTNIDPAGRYQAGGFELFGGSGGECTDCHAGENPYIVHPLSDLGSSNLMGDLNGPPQNLPTFGPNRYDPIVASGWAQNALSHSDPLVPPQCSACHQQGVAGRFPHLSTEIPGYCGTILTQAINKTMPPNAPGSLANDPVVQAFKAWCNSAATSGPSDRGDPHLTTANGINYDFQAAGEFITLRNSDTRFELQTRQTPVSTTFTPGPNAYTGLASCVSLNTAAAVRVGTHRVTFQPSLAGGGKMDLRIDGSLVNLPPQGLHLGDGNWISTIGQSGAVDIRAADGTRVLISPEFWASQGYWYLNVDVLDTPAREGTMGTIVGSDWLPLAPDGSSFGPAPASIPVRHALLNQKFADAWRVTKLTSLFDYAPGTSTETFTFRQWPPEPGGQCIVPSQRPVNPMPRERAVQLCRDIKDKNAFDNCVFDVTVTGEPGFARGYLRSLQLRQEAIAGATPGGKRVCQIVCRDAPR